MWNFLTTVFIIMIVVWLVFGMTPKEVGGLVKNGVTTINELVNTEEWKENLKESQEEKKKDLMSIFDKQVQHDYKYLPWIKKISNECKSNKCDFTKFTRKYINNPNKIQTLVPKTLMQEYDFERMMFSLEVFGYITDFKKEKHITVDGVISSPDKTIVIFDVTDMKTYNIINFLRANKIDDLKMVNYTYSFKYEYNKSNKFLERMQNMGVIVEKSFDEKAYFTMIFTKNQNLTHNKF